MDSLATANEFIAKNQAIVVLVGVPILTGLVTLLFGLVNHFSLLRSETRRRDLDRQMKIASFRYESLKELRNDFADFITSLRSWRLQNVPSHESVTDSYHKVLFQLTPTGTDYERFISLSESLLKAPDFSDFFNGHEELKRLGSRLFHDEKTEIENRLQVEYSAP